MLTTTFKELRVAGACLPSYHKLRDSLVGPYDEEDYYPSISMRCIYEILGLYDTVWAIVHVCKRSDLLFNLLGGYYMYRFEVDPKTPYIINYTKCLHIISWIKNNIYHFDNFSIEELAEKMLQLCDREENG